MFLNSLQEHLINPFPLSPRWSCIRSAVLNQIAIMNVCRLRRDNYTPLVNQVFRLFTDNCGDKTANEFADTLYGLYTVEGFMYSDDWKYWNIIDWFKNNLIPHKIAVYQAGVDLTKSYELMQWVDRGEFLDNLWVHDMSKFSEPEAWGYTNFKSKDKTLFNAAWHHHKQHNPHHPEYWFDTDKNGKTKALDMPKIYILEMIADWIGAGKTYGNSIEDWLPNNIGRFCFSENTAHQLSEMLRVIGFEAKSDGPRVYISNL